MSDLKFYCKYLVLNGKQVSQEHIDVLCENPILQVEVNDTLHIINTIHDEDNKVKLYIEYGTAMPRPDHVINCNTIKNEDNPRNKDQMEPKQLFALIDISTSCIWISKIIKAVVIEAMMEQLGIIAELKNIYSSEVFIEKIKSINGIKLTSTPEMLFKLSHLNEILNHDVYGYGANSATLELQYKKSRLLEGDVLENIKDLFSKRTSFEKFIISGRDDGNMDMVFNTESLVEKVHLKTKPDESGQFDCDTVFNDLFEEIYN